MSEEIRELIEMGFSVEEAKDIWRGENMEDEIFNTEYGFLKLKGEEEIRADDKVKFHQDVRNEKEKFTCNIWERPDGTMFLVRKK